ncbi:MAG: hypothetical protein O7C73_05790 [Nitrospirae bacterium]|nr:hypothetical protein [Nitrospirota bacterium]
MLRRLGRPWGRVKGGEYAYPRQTPLPTGGRERTLLTLANVLAVKVAQLLE